MIQKIKRKCFISYHHELDQEYVESLRELISFVKVSDYSLKQDIGHLSEETIYKKIREKMRNCSVTIVLVGEQTGFRKWIDWELWASLRRYNHPFNPLKSFKSNGLLAIYLPTRTHDVPDRLQDNIDSGYAVSMNWTNLKSHFESKVNYAYWNRTFNAYKIDNSREQQYSDY